MNLKIREGLTFDDVLLEPKFSKIKSRSTIDLSVKLSKNIILQNPIIPANMKTVTGKEMADEIYKMRGMAILHRFMPLQEQLDIAIMYGTNLYKNSQDEHLNYIGFSIGVKESDYEAVDKFAAAGVKILCIDIAHGDSEMCVKMCEYISNKYPNILLIAGNVATASGAERLWRAGADIVKVGIGPGSLCTTRIETGNGSPQLTALADVASVKKHFEHLENSKYYPNENHLKRNFLIIADGGIKNAGDCVKALCFADLVMVGNIFAGAEETPGEILNIDNNKYKSYTGSSTHKTNHIEGVAALVPVKGKVASIFNKLFEGIKSGLSYQGVDNLYSLKEDPIFIKISNAGLKESHAHDVIVVK